MFFTFYNYTQRNKRFGKFIIFTAKASSLVFSSVYASTAAYLIAKRSVGIYLFLIIPATLLLLSIFLRNIIRRPRPHMKYHLDSKYAIKKSWSFPSNHSSCASIIAFSCMFVNIYLGLIMFFLAVLTGMSRIFIGVHYPTDVIGGFVLGGVLAIIGYNLIPSFL